RGVFRDRRDWATVESGWIFEGLNHSWKKWLPPQWRLAERLEKIGKPDRRGLLRKILGISGHQERIDVQRRSPNDGVRKFETVFLSDRDCGLRNGFVQLDDFERSHKGGTNPLLVGV